MNDIDSGHEWFVDRWLAPELRRSTVDHPVVVLTGARQVGKTTLLRNTSPFKSWDYVSLDDLDARSAAELEPEALWASGGPVIIDEVQRVPGVLSAVKSAVDNDRDRRFVLSGSANLLLLSHVSESLAGRAIYLTLHPYTLGELLGLEPPGLPQADRESLAVPIPHEVGDPVANLLKGFMPAAVHLSATARLRWWQGYVATYLERDLRELSSVSSLSEFRRVMELLALRTGGLLNQSDLARDSAVSQPTVHRYIGLLEASNMLVRLRPYLANMSQRIVKAPRVMWNSPGLASYLAGLWSYEELAESRELSGLFECLVFHHLRSVADLAVPRARVLTWRTRSQWEVDFVVEHGRSVVGIEVKRTARPGFRDAAGLRRFLEAEPRASGGLLLHTGTEIKQLAERVVAAPWTALAGRLPAQ